MLFRSDFSSFNEFFIDSKVMKSPYYISFKNDEYQEGDWALL
jgi:hypothetical protein